MSKGSHQRPGDTEAFRVNYERTFGKGPCETCGGTGCVMQPVQHRDYITREMALDAGEPAMEGMEIDGGTEWVPEPCGDCEGSGVAR